MTPHPDARTATPIDAYTAAEYVVILPDREIVVRVGERSPELDEILAGEGAARGAFITAWNPSSVPRSRAENDRAHAALVRYLNEHRVRWLAHVGRSPDRQWQEHGVFALDLTDEDSVALAERFGQYGIVTLERGQPARLLLTALGQAALAG